MAVLVDSLSEATQTSEGKLNSGGDIGLGQAFTGVAGVLNSSVFYIKKTNSPTGNITAAIYDSTGTFGTNMKPTGAALATSDTVDITTIGTSFDLQTFTFSGGNKITLVEGTKYITVIQFSGGDATNALFVGIDGASHAGNRSWSADLSTWSSSGNFDVCFYVYNDDPVTTTSTSTTTTTTSTSTTTTTSTSTSTSTTTTTTSTSTSTTTTTTSTSTTTTTTSTSTSTSSTTSTSTTVSVTTSTSTTTTTTSTSTTTTTSTSTSTTTTTTSTSTTQSITTSTSSSSSTSTSTTTTTTSTSTSTTTTTTLTYPLFVEEITPTRMKVEQTHSSSIMIEKIGSNRS